jgi:UDP-N-acetylmuramate dehydrogenase
MQNLIEQLGLTRECAILYDEPLRSHTTFRIGGNAKVLLIPSTLGDIRKIVSTCAKNMLPYYIMGNGSNLLVSDKGFAGAVIKLAGTLDSVEINGREVICGAGAMVSSLYSTVSSAGLAGMEYFAGIPATAGGAVSMNMGSFGKNFSELIHEVYVLGPDGIEKSFRKNEIEFGYRKSSLSDRGYIVTGMKLGMDLLGPEEIRSRFAELLSRKLSSQPLDMPSAGCVFRNPPGIAAGYLIDNAGLKGLKVGGAAVSKKHANYIVNEGGARAEDVIRLIDEIKNRVLRHSGTLLEPEIKFLGF